MSQGVAERDGLIEARVKQALRRFQPDVVHVQHLLFLSAHLRLDNAVATLHDGWAWCARAGSMLERGEAICPGPSAERCVPCYGEWARGYSVEHALGRAAGVASKVVPVETLHKAWKRLPGRVRGLTRKGPAPRASLGDFNDVSDIILMPSSCIRPHFGNIFAAKSDIFASQKFWQAILHIFRQKWQAKLPFH